MRQGKTDIQIRGVPVSLRDRVHDKARARGRSLSAYLIELLEADVGRLTVAEWRARINARGGGIRLRNLKALKGRTVVDILHEARREAGRDA